jgi:hypothetical protein
MGAAPVPSTSCPLRMIVVPMAVFMDETLSENGVELVARGGIGWNHTASSDSMKL